MLFDFKDQGTNSETILLPMLDLTLYLLGKMSKVFTCDVSQVQDIDKHYMFQF